MKSGSILRVIAVSLALAATNGTAGAAAPSPASPPGPTSSLGELIEQVWTWSAELPTVARRISTALPTFGELMDPAGWSTRWIVELRNLGTAAVYDTLALLPAPPIPDLTILTASPVPGVESSGFGWRRDPFHHRDKFHKGTDFRADRGTPVYSAGAGVVAFTGRQTGYGNIIYVDHGGGVVTRYAHLSRIEIKTGAAVPAAKLIGRVGATGRATGPHLHFEIRLEGRAVDPELAMQVASLQRTDPGAARWAAWLLSPGAQDGRIDRHDPPRHFATDKAKPRRPERRHAPARDRNRS